MKTKILSVVLVLMMAFSCVAYADMTLNTPVFDYDTLKLEISGDTTNNYSEGVTLSVMPYSVNRDALTDASLEESAMLFDYVASDKNGVFTYSATLNDNFVAGKYAVYADTSTQTAVTTFILVNGTEAQSVIDLINNAANAATVKGLIGDNADKLGVDALEYAKYDAYISNVIYASKPEGGYTTEEFVKQYYIAYVAAQLKNGATTLDTAVIEYGAIIGIDAERYNELSDNAKTELESLIKSETGFKGDVMNYEYNYVLAQIKTASGYEEQGGYIIDNADFIGIDLEKYESITNKFYKDKALQDVFDTGYTSLEAVVTVWNKAVDEAYSEWKNGNTTSGGSGGGGGGGSGGFAGGIGTDNGFTVTDYDDNKDMFTEQGKPQYSEDKSEPFSDIISHWAYESIIHMYKEGIVNGYEDSTFRPNNTVTRAEFVKMLTGAINLATTNTSGVSFNDVSDSAWYANCVKLAAANGLVQGHDGMFRPLDNISRQDAAVIIYNAIAGYGYNVEGEKTFNDTNDISDYAKAYVSALAANGVINGSDGNFLPKNTLTRAEAVKLIENLLDYIDFKN